MTPFALTCPVAAVAATPYLLGYEPEHSLVVLNLDGTQISSSMRVDLPWCASHTGEDADVADMELDEWAHSFVTSYAHLAHGGIVLLTFTDGPCPAAERLLLDLRDAYECHTDVRDALLVTGAGEQLRWASVLCGDKTCCPREGKPMEEAEADRVRTFFILHGRAPALRREDLVREVAAADDQRARRIRRKVSTYQRLMRGGGAGAGFESKQEEWRDAAIASIGAVLEVSSVVKPAAALPEDAIVRTLVAMADTRVRDTVMWELTQATRERDWEQIAGLLADAVRVAPRGFVAPIATTLGQVRWAMGDGVRASVALERALADDPRYTMAGLLQHAIGSGIPPSSWIDTLRAVRREEFRYGSTDVPRAS